MLHDIIRDWVDLKLDRRRPFATLLNKNRDILPSPPHSFFLRGQKGGIYNRDKRKARRAWVGEGVKEGVKEGRKEGVLRGSE